MTETVVQVAMEGMLLPGTLSMPANCVGVVAFAHGSGSSRLSPRNRAVAAAIIDQGCGTLLFDLLSDGEAADRRNVFDIALLARRVVGATRWLREQSMVGGRPIGYFGASTGAAAAIVAAAALGGQVGGQVGAVVSRGGRPDLAGDALQQLTAPTLLIVGSRDQDVLELNRQAQRRMRCENQLEVIQGATHLFEEPGTLEEVADKAGSWFLDRLTT